MMPYRSTDKTRQKKDTKRTAMMQAAMEVFSEKGYHNATVRDIVAKAGVAVGTFYFYFPDKETLFVFLFEETADFLLQAISQGINSRRTLAQQIPAGLQAYLNIALFEPALVQLLLISGVDTLPQLANRREAYRERLTQIWQRPLDDALDQGHIVPQNTRRTAEALAGAFDEVVINLISLPDPAKEAQAALEDMVDFTLRAVVYSGN